MRYNRPCQIALLLIFLTLTFGCTSQKLYDVSSLSPFSDYSNKSIASTRELLLIADRGGAGLNPLPLEDERVSYSIQYKGDSAPETVEENKFRSVLILPPGTLFHIGQTWLSSDDQGFTQAFFHLEEIYTRVNVTLNSPGWPRNVKTAFFYFGPGPSARDKIKIRPAPWEPAGTASERIISWPDDKYLVPKR